MPSDPIVEANGLPVNQAGEIVAIAGSGDTVVVGQLNSNSFPIDVASKKLIISGLGSGGSSSVVTSFSPTIPLTTSTTMSKYTVNGAIAFVPAAGATAGSSCLAVLVANGVNAPTFTGGFAAVDSEWGSSQGYVNTIGYTNVIQFWYDGVGYRYSTSQPVTQVLSPVPSTGITMTGPTSGASGVASTAFTIAFAAVGSTPPTVTITPSDGGAGGTFTPATLTAAGTFTYTPSSAGAKTISITNNAGLTNPSNITYTATAADTTAPVIQSAAINGSTLTLIYNEALNTTAPTLSAYSLSLAGGAGVAPTAAVVSGTNVSLTFATAATNGQSAALTYTAGASAVRDTAGNNAANLSAYTVTNNTAASGSGVVVRMNAPTSNGLVETGDATNGYNYTGSAAGFVNFGVTNLAMAADGTYYAKVGTTTVGPAMLTMMASTTPAAYGSGKYGMYADVATSNAYKVQVNGVSVTVNTIRVPAVNDMMRIQRAGSTWTFAVSSDAGTTWNTIHTVTGGLTSTLYPGVCVTNAADSVLSNLRADGVAL